LSVITAQSVFNLLKSALTAENEEMFAVKFPKQVKPKAEFLSVDEQKRLEQAAKERGSTDYIAVIICLYTGFRIGDLCGLLWSDIDFDCKLLRINRTLQRIRSEGENKTEVTFLTPKSITSTREIPLPDFLLELLFKHRAITNGEYILNYKNKPIEPRTLQYRFKKILQAADVKDVGFHTCRHTFATRALESGCDVKSLSEILGHGSAMVCENPDSLKNLYNQVFSSKFKALGLKNIHADYVAAVALGDYLAETIIFGTNSETALKEAIECGCAVYSLNENQLTKDAIDRAWDFVQGWLISNTSRFNYDASPYYGKIIETPGGQFFDYFVIPQYLDFELEKAGFNVKKTFQGFRERGYIQTYHDSEGKVRTKISGRIEGKLLAGYVFRLENNDIKPLNGNQPIESTPLGR
jgi:site-specific recombinase XerD